MKKPSEVLIPSGNREYNAHVHNIQAGIRFIINHWDDLSEGTEMDAYIEEKMESFYRSIVPKLEKANE